MRITIDSKYSDQKSLEALREFISSPSTKELRLSGAIIEMCSVVNDYSLTRPKIDVDFHATAECFPSHKHNLVTQIVSLFDKVSDDRDLEFLKRYFQIKLK